MTLLYLFLWQNLSEHFFLAEVRSSGLQACNVSEKKTFYNYFLGIVALDTGVVEIEMILGCHVILEDR